MLEPHLLDIFGWSLSIPLLLALFYMTLEVSCGLPRRRRARPEDASTPHTKIAVLIPAYNEQDSVARTVRSVAKDCPNAHIVVVADNCEDNTAKCARNAGANVVERHDNERRGKGYALAYGRDFLAADPPATVIVLDADCLVSAGSVDGLARSAMRANRPAQAINLFRPDHDLSPALQISNFAMFVKNLVRMRGLARLSGTVALLGTGMAFPWPKFQQLALSTGDAVEDIRTTLDCITAGIPIEFVEDAQVWSSAEQVSDTIEQRTRWEHGFLNHAIRYGVPTVLKGLMQGSRARVFIGLHLLVPPLAMLAVSVVIAMVILVALWVAGGSWHALAMLLVGSVAAAMALTVAWLKGGNSFLSSRAVIKLPAYVLWKLPIYLKYFRGRQKDWGDGSP